MAEKVTLVGLKAEVSQSFDLLDTFQDRVQRAIVLAFPRPWAGDFLTWLTNEMSGNPRRVKAGEQLTGYLKAVGQCVTRTVTGVTLVETPAVERKEKQAIHRRLKSSHWASWKPAQAAVSLPDLGDGPVAKMAELLAINALTEESARQWASSLVDAAIIKIHSRPVTAKVEKLIGAGLVARSEEGRLEVVKAA